MIEKIKIRVFGADQETIDAYHSALPNNLHVTVRKDGNYLIANIDEIGNKKVKGLLVTEAKDTDSLVRKVNDLIYTYVDTPDYVRSHYGDIFLPESKLRAKKSQELVLVKN